MSGTVDFYKILEVNKQATADEIKISYKKLARVWHPDKNPDPVKKTEAETKFKEISQAYDVLKDPDKRKAYDWELEDQAYKSTLAAPPPWNYQPTSSFSAGWTSTTGFYYHKRYPPNNWFGDSMPGGGYHGSRGDAGYHGWSFGSSDSGSLGGSSRSSSNRSGGGGFGSPGGEPRKAARFGSSLSSSARCDSCDFGEPSKAASFGGSRSNSTNSSGGGGDFGGIGGEPRKAATVEHVLLCTLEELYNGGTKEILITRKTLDASGKVQTREEKEIIDVKPGWKKGTRITFPEKGDQLEPGVIPADVVYEVDEIPHPVYKRDGDNLIAFHQITKAELNSGQFFLPSLDGKQDLMVGLPNNKEKAGNLDRPNEGMPISKEPGKKGNLRITYWVEGGGSPIKRVVKRLTRGLTLITCFRRRRE